ncbi:MAG: hypothetical protein JXJ04_26985 [Spirochaetales bacterium]|nr:hypothetical protein [Spirochaetales bacterium]
MTVETTDDSVLLFHSIDPGAAGLSAIENRINKVIRIAHGSDKLPYNKITDLCAPIIKNYNLFQWGNPEFDKEADSIQ